MSHEIQGGWRSQPKSNPVLWNQVLQRVHRQHPGPWAAWKSMKAVQYYKAAGGTYT